MRVVIDTNIWISYLLRPASDLTATVDTILTHDTVLYRVDAFVELAQVFVRPKFARYVVGRDVHAFIASVMEIAEEVPAGEEIRACRDRKDDKFLEIAVNGRADCLVSGDRDLLALHPFRGIAVLQPRDVAAFRKAPIGS